MPANLKEVLVVEDNIDNLRLITKVLERGGYRVTAVSDGAAALDLVSQENLFQFIIMDINLPDMDGLEVAKKIRALKGELAAPIIAITSYAMRGDMDRILKAGCAAYFEKPIDPLRILEDILNVIGRPDESPDS